MPSSSSSAAYTNTEHPPGGLPEIPDNTEADLEENVSETSSARGRRYRNSSLEEVSDPELWMLWHHFDTTSSSEPDEQGANAEPNVGDENNPSTGS